MSVFVYPSFPRLEYKSKGFVRTWGYNRRKKMITEKREDEKTEELKKVKLRG